MLWEHHGILATGTDIVDVFDAVDTLNKAAKNISLPCMNYYFQDKDSTIIAFQTEEELGEQSVQKLLWLLEGARLLQPDHPALQVRYIKGLEEACLLLGAQ